MLWAFWSHNTLELTTKGLQHLIKVNDDLIIWINKRGWDYLILVDISSEPLYILRCLADLGCQTSRVSHLRIFLINIFHLPQGLTEERGESERGAREEGGKWLSVEIGSLQSSGLSKQFKNSHRRHRGMHTDVHCLNSRYALPPEEFSQRWLLIHRRCTYTQKHTHLWSTSFCNSLQISSSFCCNLFLRCSGGRWVKSSVTVGCKSSQEGWVKTELSLTPNCFLTTVTTHDQRQE